MIVQMAKEERHVLGCSVDECEHGIIAQHKITLDQYLASRLEIRNRTFCLFCKVFYIETPTLPRDLPNVFVVRDDFETPRAHE